MTPSERRALWSVVIAAIALRAAIIWPMQLHRWDEAYHAVVANNLTAHPLEPTLFDDPNLPHDDQNWERAHVFLHKPPLAMWLMAASISALGATAPAARLPSALLDIAAVVVTFSLARHLWGIRPGLWAAAFHAVSPGALLFVSGVVGSDHVNIHLAFWVELAVYAIVRLRKGGWAWALLGGAACGAGVLSKGAPGLLPCALFLAALPIATRSRSGTIAAGLVLAASAAAVALPWNLYASRQWPIAFAAVQRDEWLHLTSVVEGHGHNPLYHLGRIAELHGVLAYVAMACFLFRTAKTNHWRDRVVAAWWVIPFVVFTAAQTKLTSYMFVAAPAVYLMQGAFVASALESSRRWMRWLAVGVFASALAGGGWSVRRALRQDPNDAALIAFAQTLPPRTVVTGLSPYYSVEAMFFGAAAAYPERWDPNTRTAVEQKGYRVVEAICAPVTGAPLPAGLCSD
jgi:4-amino-4-deoxy-L-arabinose transferase-like glycosyltransferase